MITDNSSSLQINIPVITGFAAEYHAFISGVFMQASEKRYKCHVRKRALANSSLSTMLKPAVKTLLKKNPDSLFLPLTLLRQRLFFCPKTGPLLSVLTAYFPASHQFTHSSRRSWPSTAPEEPGGCSAEKKSILTRGQGRSVSKKNITGGVNNGLKGQRVTVRIVLFHLVSNIYI
ncbi:TPA: hypothetical protein U2R15_004160 [Klebsiella aerogenes]|nr:hypothetical protein [Klebsiella aerogenes]